MKLTAPTWMTSFHCIADRCRHTCCAGWEIDVDEDTLAAYRQVPGPFGQRLKNGIREGEDGASFVLDEHERCPFLNRQGLCDIILELGEEALCEICTDHPRYRGFLRGSTEIGPGLCCEEACRLVLTWPEPMSLITLEDDGQDDEDEEDRAFLAFRARLLTLLQDRTKPARERIGDILTAMGIDMPAFDRRLWAERLLSLERMDDQWTAYLNRWHDSRAETAPSLEQWERMQEQFAAASLHRHMTVGLEEGDTALYALLALLGWQIVSDMASALELQTEEDIIELVRLYSSEIEYSQENLDALLDWLEEIE